MKAEELCDMALREPCEFAGFLQSCANCASLRRFKFVHADAAAFSPCCLRNSQTNAAISSMVRARFVVASMNMFMSLGMVSPISVAKMVVATGQTLLSNLGPSPTGLVEPLNGGQSKPLLA